MNVNERRDRLPAPVLAIIATIVLGLLAFNLWLPQGRDVFGKPTQIDFTAFYCAGSVVRDHRDPYRAEPLGACEHRLLVSSDVPRGLTVPAPLPGYALVPFVALSYLPYAWALAIWSTTIAGATASSMYLLAKFARAPYSIVVPALVLSLGASSLVLGQIVPIALAALCAAGAAIERNDDRTASVAFGVAAIEPHLTLLAAITVAIVRPRSRVWLALVGMLLAAMTIWTLGPSLTREYIVEVLPRHLRSELYSQNQYALTPVLVQFGVKRGLAISLGTASSIVAGILSIVVAPAIAKRTGTNAAIAFVPAAFALTGGTFLHVTQLAFAIPLVLLLWSSVETSRPLASAALLSLAIPWGIFGELAAVLPLVGATFGVLWYGLIRKSLAQSAITGMAAMIAIVALKVTCSRAPDVGSLIAAASAPNRFAEATWAIFTAGVTERQYLVSSVARSFSWLGIVFMWAATAAALRYGVAAATEQTPPAERALTASAARPS